MASIFSINFACRLNFSLLYLSYKELKQLTVLIFLEYHKARNLLSRSIRNSFYLLSCFRWQSCWPCCFFMAQLLPSSLPQNIFPCSSASTHCLLTALLASANHSVPKLMSHISTFCCGCYPYLVLIFCSS